MTEAEFIASLDQFSGEEVAQGTIGALCALLIHKGVVSREELRDGIIAQTEKVKESKEKKS